MTWMQQQVHQNFLLSCNKWAKMCTFFWHILYFSRLDMAVLLKVQTWVRPLYTLLEKPNENVLSNVPIAPFPENRPEPSSLRISTWSRNSDCALPLWMRNDQSVVRFKILCINWIHSARLEMGFGRRGSTIHHRTSLSFAVMSRVRCLEGCLAHDMSSSDTGLDCLEFPHFGIFDPSNFKPHHCVSSPAHVFASSLHIKWTSERTGVRILLCWQWHGSATAARQPAQIWRCIILSLLPSPLSDAVLTVLPTSPWISVVLVKWRK